VWWELSEPLASPIGQEPEPERQQPAEVDATLHIQVSSLTGKRVHLAVQASDSVERVKRMLYVEAGSPPMEQRLLFNGGELANDSTMEWGGVVDGSTIHLTLRLVDSIGVVDSGLDTIQMVGGSNLSEMPSARPPVSAKDRSG
jgi:hypothetical protein